jgi:hypothetical protein
MHTEQKGSITEAVILADLMKRGLRVLMPYSKLGRYDLAVDAAGKLVRFQCKTARLERGAITFNVATTVNKFSKAAVRRPYTASEIDWFAVYYPPSGQVFYVPIGVCGRSSFAMRLTPPKTRTKKVHYAKDFEDLILLR